MKLKLFKLKARIRWAIPESLQGKARKRVLLCLTLAVLFPVARLFGIVKPALLIAVVGIIIKFFSGDEVLISPLRFTVALVFTVTGVSFISILFPITNIPGVILVLALLGILVLIDYWTKGKYEWYTRAIIVPILFVCILWPDAWGVNELFYGATLQALRLPDWAGRGMNLIDKMLIKYCELA